VDIAEELLAAGPDHPGLRLIDALSMIIEAIEDKA